MIREKQPNNDLPQALIDQLDTSETSSQQQQIEFEHKPIESTQKREKKRKSAQAFLSLESDPDIEPPTKKAKTNSKLSTSDTTALSHSRYALVNQQTNVEKNKTIPLEKIINSFSSKKQKFSTFDKICEEYNVSEQKLIIKLIDHFNEKIADSFIALAGKDISNKETIIKILQEIYPKIEKRNEYSNDYQKQLIQAYEKCEKSELFREDILSFYENELIVVNKKVKNKSDEILDLTYNINALKMDKRQPLELFTLRKRQEELKKNYDIDSEQQVKLAKDFLQLHKSM